MLEANSVPVQANAKAPTSVTQGQAEVKTSQELKSKQ